MSLVGPTNPCAKGPVTYALDKIVKVNKAVNKMSELAASIGELESANYIGLEKVFAEKLFPEVIKKNGTPDKEKIDAITKYLKEYWFDPTSEKIEFKGLQPIAPVYAVGVRKTLDLALRSLIPRAIDSWWIVDYPDIMLLNLASEKEVKLLIMTPRPEKIVPAGVWSDEVEDSPGSEAHCTYFGAVETRQIENKPTKPK